ncbi:MAG: hypothetical protein ABI395_05435 [Sphingobium sp.]
MRVHQFAFGAAGFSPDHPLEFNVQVHRLPLGLAAGVQTAIAAGTLPAHMTAGTNPWVRFSDLVQQIGPDHDVADPNDPYFVPPHAILDVPYLLEPNDAALTHADPEERQAVLRTAAREAGQIVEWRRSWPPRPFNVRVDWMSSSQAGIAQAVQTGRLRTREVGGAWWVSADDVRSLAPSEDALHDPASGFYLGFAHRIDHDAADRRIVEHRKTWPDVYQ